jgi:hypothetical protein
MHCHCCDTPLMAYHDDEKHATIYRHGDGEAVLELPDEDNFCYVYARDWFPYPRKVGVWLAAMHTYERSRNMDNQYQPYLGLKSLQDMLLFYMLWQEAKMNHDVERRYRSLDCIDPDHVAAVLRGDEMPLPGLPL